MSGVVVVFVLVWCFLSLVLGIEPSRCLLLVVLSYVVLSCRVLCFAVFVFVVRNLVLSCGFWRFCCRMLFRLVVSWWCIYLVVSVFVLCCCVSSCVAVRLCCRRVSCRRVLRCVLALCLCLPLSLPSVLSHLPPCPVMSCRVLCLS